MHTYRELHAEQDCPDVRILYCHTTSYIKLKISVFKQYREFVEGETLKDKNSDQKTLRKYIIMYKAGPVLLYIFGSIIWLQNNFAGQNI